ncbi:hypothetical protein DPMN_165543 [Dreissena polymorpha]|uniref:Uncharacterized protein n=1 Tax=Dreissena polymorpha TaxID=45954 RepID=A0A9D4EV13_DREPO|nr:hypothetical protein DPMN_165543 [Dreissena polymorpha]
MGGGSEQFEGRKFSGSRQRPFRAPRRGNDCSNDDTLPKDLGEEVTEGVDPVFCHLRTDMCLYWLLTI